MFNIEELLPLILSMIPSILNIVVALRVYVVLIKKFLKMDSKVDLKNEELKKQINIVLQENYRLKKQINELLTKIDHVERK